MQPPKFTIAIPVYPRVDLLDVSAPKEVFSWLGAHWSARDVEVLLVAESHHAIRTRDGTQILPDRAFDEVPHVDLLWVPGGDPKELVVQMANPHYVDFLQRTSHQAMFVASVCEGALLAANAGLFDGYRVTTHWAFRACLASYPKVTVEDGYPRYVHDGNRITGGGISAGLDESLYIVSLLAGQEAADAVQVQIQYFPEPPANGSIPAQAECPLAGELPVPMPPLPSSSTNVPRKHVQ